MKHKSRKSKKTIRKAATGRTKKQHILDMTADIEKEFFALPATLSALCRRELAQLKQQETRLGASIRSATVKQKATLKKLASLKAHGKKSGIRYQHKRISAAKNLVMITKKTLLAIQNERKLIQKTRKGIQQKQAGFELLSKELPRLRKQMTTAGRKKTAIKIRKKQKIRARTVRKTDYSLPVSIAVRTGLTEEAS